MARTADGAITTSDVVQNTHHEGILDTTTWPVTFDSPMLRADTLARVRDYAFRVALELQLEGALCLEFFVDQNYNLLLNEMAPRPHNSFHGSIEAAHTSQFEQHIRAICGLPLGQVAFHSSFEMQNLIGGRWEDWRKALYDPLARLHLYGKKESRPHRKLGHVTRLFK